MYFYKKLELLAFISLFYPFFMLIPISAEIQPLGLFFWLAGLVLIKKRLTNEFLLLTFGMGVIILTSAILHMSSYFQLKALIISIVIIYTPLLTFLFSKSTDLFINKKVYKVLFAPWLLMSIVQTFTPNLLPSIGLDSLIQVFIPRFLPGSAENGRGVGGLAPEPSYASYVYLAFAVWLWFLKSKRIFNNKELWLYTVLLVACLVMNKSMFAIVVLLFFVFIMIESKSILSIIFIVLPSIAFLSLGFNQDELRFMMFLARLLSSSNFSDIMISFQAFSSTREVGVLVGYESLRLNVFGVGVGNGSTVFFDILKSFSFIMPEKYGDIIGEGAGRPYAYMSFLTLELGYLALYPLIIIAYFNRKVMFTKNFYRGKRKWIFLLFIILLFLRAPVSMPVTMLLIGILLKSSEIDLRSRNG